MRYVPWLVFVGSLAILVGLLAVWWVPASPESPPAVVVYTAAAMRPAAEKAAGEFHRDTGIRIDMHFGASEDLLSKLKLTRVGDLFIPADDSYVALARADGLVDEEYAIGSLTGVAVFRSDFAKDANDITWDDIFRDGFRLAQPNPGTAIGKRTRQGLEPIGLWARIEASRPVQMGTVTETANAVKLGSADGAIIWDATANQYPQLKVVRLPNLDRVTASVTVALCKDSLSRAEARRFAEFLAGPGQKHFRDAGVAPPVQGPRK